MLADEASATGDVSAIKDVVRALLPARRFLDWRGSTEYARDAQDVVPMLERLVDSGHATKAIPLIEDAFGRINRLLRHADDSGGAIGSLAHELLDLHLKACNEGQPDPRKLAGWLIKIAVDDDYQYFHPLVDEYAGALGSKGIAAYRKAVQSRWEHGDRGFGVRYAVERLARHDRDVDKLVELYTTNPHGLDHYGLASTLFEIGLPDEGLAWAERGIDAGRIMLQRNVYDLAVAEHIRRGSYAEAVRLRRENLDRMPTARTYAALRDAAEDAGTWPAERADARRVLAARSVGELVTALIADGDADEAWSVAQGQELPAHVWRSLADVRQRTHPADAIPIFEEEIRELLQQANRRNYKAAAARLKFLRTVCDRVDPQRFESFVADLREEHRRRPTFIKELDRAGLP